MMNQFHIKVAEHNLEIICHSCNLAKLFSKNYMITADDDFRPDLTILIKDGYGVAFVDYEVSMNKKNGYRIYRRADYEIKVDSDFTTATILVHDELALKHAMMNLYSAFIVHHNWGLLLHSSSVMDSGEAHVFSGHSGAGKSTAAKLSAPRTLLADEASIIKITQGSCTVFNSPFRSELVATDVGLSVPLESIQLLHQSPQNNRLQLGKVDSIIQLIDKVFYWGNQADDTKGVIELLKMLVGSVTVYDLYFKKDETFWELITNETIHTEVKI